MSGLRAAEFIEKVLREKKCTKQRKNHVRKCVFVNMIKSICIFFLMALLLLSLHPLA